MLFVFNGDPQCFIHVLLNALDMNDKGYQARIVLEGASVKLLPKLVQKKFPLHQLWLNVMEKGLIEGVCKACAAKLGTLEDAKEQSLPILDNMSGHPSMVSYFEAGFEVLTF